MAETERIGKAWLTRKVGPARAGRPRRVLELVVPDDDGVLELLPEQAIYLAHRLCSAAAGLPLIEHLGVYEFGPTHTAQVSGCELAQIALGPTRNLDIGKSRIGHRPALSSITRLTRGALDGFSLELLPPACRVPPCAYLGRTPGDGRAGHAAPGRRAASRPQADRSRCNAGRPAAPRSDSSPSAEGALWQ